MREADQFADALRRYGDVLLAVLPGIALCSLHANILAVPKADFIDALDSDRYRIQWITGSYILGTAAGMALTRFTCGRLGMRAAYLLAILFFAIFGSACGLVDSVQTMTPLRLLQGYGHGQMISVGMVLVWRAFPADKALAMALYGLAIYVPGTTGATLGGWLTMAHSWRLIFLLLLPLGGVAALPALRWLPRDEAKPPRSRFDVVGFVLLLSWIATMSVVLDMGQYWGWLNSPEFVPWFSAFVLCFGGFILWGVFAANPLINLRALGRRNFALGIAIKALFSINLVTLLGLLSGYMVNLRGYQWHQASLVISPTVATMVLSAALGAFTGTPGNRKLRLCAGLGIMAAATCAFTTVDMYTSNKLLAAYMAIWGSGAGLVIAPALLTAFEGLAPEETLRTAGVFNILRSIPSFVGGATLSIMLTRSTDAHFDSLRQNIRYNRPIVEEALIQPNERFQRSTGPATKQAHATLSKWVHANSRAFAFQDVFGYLAIVPAAGMVLALFVRVRQPASSGEASAC